ncbi:MAG: DUF1828 domain-containing protein [Pseudomonadota bacterium]
MKLDTRQLRADLCDGFSLRQEDGITLIETPFVYDDRDKVVAFVESSETGWRVHDNGEAAFRLMLEGVNLESSKISRWIEQCGILSGVHWSAESEQLETLAGNAELARAIFRVAEASAQMQALAVLQEQRSAASDFKEVLKSLLAEVSQECDIPVDWDSPVDQHEVFRADAVFRSRRPLAVIAANSAERLLEAEMIWMEAKNRKADLYVLAVTEDEKKPGHERVKKAQYYTDKTVEFSGMADRFRELVRSQITH